jgi:hypothetical protein
MEKILDTTINREKGYLYFVKGDPLAIYKAEMSRGRKKKAEPKEEITNDIFV